MGHFSGTHNAFLSEGGVLAVVVGDFPETPHQTGDDTYCPRPLRKSAVRRRPPLARRNGAPYGRGDGGESDPPFFGADAPPEEGKWATPKATPYPSSGRVALTTVIPGGKAEMLKTRTRVVLLNLALAGAGILA